MRRHPRLILGFLVLGLLAVTGCQKLQEERKLSVEPGVVNSVSIDAPRSQQQVSVTVTSSGSPVNIHIVPESAHLPTQKALLDGKKLDAANVLGSKEKVENDTVEATIPAKTGFSIFVSGAKKQADVTLKIVGK